jgi:glycosyltransferase involved in cell wall biosynthesis
MLSAGHTVSVVYVAERFGVDFAESEMAAQCSAVQKVQFAGPMPTLLRWLGGMSVSQAWCGSTMAKAAIRDLASDADVVWVEHLRGVGMLPGGIKCPIIWDAVDALGPLFDGRAKLVNNPIKAFVFGCEAKRTLREEAALASRFAATLAVTNREAALIGPNVVAIPNGVDLDYFHPTSDSVKTTGLLHISMVGRWNYLPNADGCARFLRDVWPEVSRAFPDAICTVIGPGSERGSLVADAAARYQAAGTVVVTGPVPDVRPFIQQSVLTICPATLAAGMQNKILESLACGVPVVCTAIAAEGTLPGGMPGLFQASTPDNMVTEITNLLSDPDAARSLGLQGRDALAQTMSWHPSYAKIAALLERVLQS